MTHAPPARPRRPFRWKFHLRVSALVLLAAALLVIISYLFRFSFFFELVSLEHIMAWVEMARQNRMISFLFFCFFAVGVMALPITLFPIVGGVLLPFWLALPVNMLAATIGALLSFLVGRFGRRTVEPFVRGRLKSWDRIAASQGFTTVFLLRFIGIPPFIIANYALGLSGVRVRDYLMGTFFGILPWMTLVTYGATSLWRAVTIGGEEGLMTALFEAVAPLTILSVLTLAALGVGAVLKKRQRTGTEPV